MAYLSRLLVYILISVTAMAFTNTWNWWPAYSFCCLLFPFVPLKFMAEIIPDVLEEVVEALLD